MTGQGPGDARPPTGRLVLLTRWPEPGLVKTRLAVVVSPEAACRLYRAAVGASGRPCGAPGRA